MLKKKEATQQTSVIHTAIAFFETKNDHRIIGSRESITGMNVCTQTHRFVFLLDPRSLLLFALLCVKRRVCGDSVSAVLVSLAPICEK